MQVGLFCLLLLSCIVLWVLASGREPAGLTDDGRQLACASKTYARNAGYRLVWGLGRDAWSSNPASGLGGTPNW